eukprot:15480073-Alexandrium_andersonii.AAC.1
MAQNPRTLPWRVKFNAAFGLRAHATDYGLRTDYGLPPHSALDRIAGLRIIPGPGQICIRPGCWALAP